MPHKVVITVNSPGRSGPPKTMLEVFESSEIEYSVIPCSNENELIAAAKDADVLLVGTVPHTTREVMENLPKLKMIGRSGVGVDSVDLDAATELGICVTNTPGINTSEVADHAMALLLSITRQIPELTKHTKEGAWSDNPQKLMNPRNRLRRIAGTTVGIYGFGNIGKAFSSRIKGFGPERIIAHDPYIPQSVADLYGVKLVSFEELITESDIITVHSPATSENNHQFNLDAFSKMKETAIFINCARGPIVDESDLAHALNNNLIYHAGIDVTEIEPLDAESPLLKTENLFLTPHYAGGSNFTASEGSKRWAENAVNVLTGQKLWGLANPDVKRVITIMRTKGSNKWDDIPDPVTDFDFS